MMEETVTITGTQLGWISFLLMTFFHIMGWLIPWLNFRKEQKRQNTRIKLREIQMRRDKVCSEMINYKREYGYSYKPDDIKLFAELAMEENKLFEKLEEIK